MSAFRTTLSNEIHTSNCFPYSCPFYYAFLAFVIANCTNNISYICNLQLKEVAPHTALSEETEAFWKRDIQVGIL